ncbi:MAG: cytochrome-c peroxidase, partial [Blastocatellia bacterium]
MKPPVQNVWRKLLIIVVFGSLTFAALAQNNPRTNAAKIRLGYKLFKDARFSSPQGDLQNSCASCHLQDEDPQGMRAHTDFFSRSWVPWRGGDPRRDELRNSPTILDAGLMPRLHFDGEFASLEDLVKGTLAGRPMGWLAGERDQAFDHIYKIIVSDRIGNYRADFKAAYGADLAKVARGELIENVTSAIADYMRTLKSARTTPYDRFVKDNGLDAGPEQGEDPKLFAGRLLGKVAALEAKRTLKLSKSFDETALKGMRIYFST